MRTDTPLEPQPITIRAIWHAFTPRTDTEDAYYWGNKACRGCKQFKPLNAFHSCKNPRMIADRHSYCKACRAQRKKERAS